jgi:drug/metabolite transporter (DMT)-like permease
MRRVSASTGVALVVLSAVAFGLMPVFARFGYAAGLDVRQLLALRFAMAAIVFFAWLALRGALLLPTRAQLSQLALLGAGMYALMSLCYFAAVAYLPAALVSLLLYLYPTIVTLLSAAIDRTRPSRRTVAALVASLVGMALVVGVPRGELSAIGLVFAFISPVCYAIYIMIGSRIVTALPPTVMSAYIILFAAISLLVIAGVSGRLTLDVTPAGWLALAGVTLVSTVLSVTAFFAGAEVLGPVRASILSLAEPAVTIGAMAAAFGEIPTAWQMVGAVIVLSAAGLVAAGRARESVGSA